MTLVEELYMEIVSILEDGIQPLEDLIALTSLVMSLIQKRRELSKHGETKKQILTIIFTDLANKSGLFTPEQSLNMINFIENSLPVIADNLKTFARAIYETSKSKCCFTR